MKVGIPQFFSRMGIRAKLIIIFVAIKVVPLVLLAGYAWCCTWVAASRAGTPRAACT